MNSMLGRRVKYTVGEGEEAKEIIGICVGERRTDTTILDTNTGREWPGIRFTVRSGGREVETVTYPDTRPEAMPQPAYGRIADNDDPDPFQCPRCGSPQETEEAARNCEETHKTRGALY